jgi:uncharacterized protein YjbI with pentapeptide repeats
LHDVEFAEADLTNVVLHNCDLLGSKFDNTILEGCDFRTTNNFSIDPEKNRMKKAKFSRNNVEGLLRKYAVVID